MQGTPSVAEQVPYEAFFKLDTGTHNGDIDQLRVTPDGRTLISAGEFTIRVWDLATRRPLRMLLGQVADVSEQTHGNGLVGRFAISRDGRWVVVLKTWRHRQATAGDAGRVTEVQVFELATGNLQAAFTVPGLLFDLDFSVDGRFLAFAGNRCEGRTRRALVQVYHARDILNGGFASAPRPLTSLTLGRTARSDGLPAAVRFIPESATAGAPYRLVVALQPSSAPASRARSGLLAWCSFVAPARLRQDHMAETEVAIAPATLAASHEFCVVGGENDPRRRKRFGRFLCHDHRGTHVSSTLTESPPASIAFSRTGGRLLVGLAIDTAPTGGGAADGPPPVLLGAYNAGLPGSAADAVEVPDPPAPESGGGAPAVPGDQTVQVNAYDTGRGEFELFSTYYGHDGSVGAVAFLEDGSAVSSGGDNQAIHFWSAQHRVGELSAAIRGAGRTYFAPGINAQDRVLFGTVPRRLLPPNSAQRQQSFDLRTMTLKTTCPSEVDDADAESARWSIRALDAVRTIALHCNAGATDMDAPPDLTLFVGADDEWVVWTRSGYFDASANGARHVGYHVNRGPRREALFLPSDRFKAFYRPDIVRAVVEHGSESRARAAGVRIAPVDVARMLPPIVEAAPGGVVAHAKHVALTFTVEAPRADQPVTRIWILKNDRFVWAEAKPRARAKARYEVKLPIGPGRNVFSILAENGDAKSMPAVVEVIGPEALAAAGQAVEPPGRLYLLSVGVSDFAVAGTDASAGYKALPFAHRDAIAVYNAFAKSNRSPVLDRRTKLYNPAFEKVEATLLLNDEATKDAILDALGALCERINERGEAAGAGRDVLFVFLSGHGTRFKGEPELYFWNYDLQPSAERMAETGLSMTELGAIVTSAAAEVVLVIDACHAGMAGGNVVSGLDAEELARRIHAVNERGMYVLNAARGEEKARDNASAGLGVFTSALLGTLASPRFYAAAAAGGSGRALSMFGMMAGVTELVPYFSAIAQTPVQTPVCRMYGDLLPLNIFQS